MKLFRCSSLSKLVGEPKSKSEALTDTAKTYIRECLREDLFGYRSFTGNKMTQKGVMLEDVAIANSGECRFDSFQKHVGRVENEYITGECDILDLDEKLIIDTKCSWDIGTHPFFKFEAEEKAKKAGYDWQMQGYMWLYDCDFAEVDFWLFPCPIELLDKWDNKEDLIDKVNAIPLAKRLTTVRYERDENKINKIIEKVKHAQEYYEQLKNELV